MWGLVCSFFSVWGLGGEGGPFIIVVWLVGFLGLLARKGALGAFERGRNWCVAKGDLERYVGSIGEGRRKLVGLWCSAWWIGGHPHAFVFYLYLFNLFFFGALVCF